MSTGINNREINQHHEPRVTTPFAFVTTLLKSPAEYPCVNSVHLVFNTSSEHHIILEYCVYVDLDRGYLNKGSRALKQGDNLKRCEKRPLRGESDRVPGCIASFGIVVISNRYPGRIQESNVCCSRVITSQVPPGNRDCKETDLAYC